MTLKSCLEPIEAYLINRIEKNSEDSDPPNPALDANKRHPKIIDQSSGIGSTPGETAKEDLEKSTEVCPRIEIRVMEFSHVHIVQGLLFHSELFFVTFRPFLFQLIFFFQLQESRHILFFKARF